MGLIVFNKDCDKETKRTLFKYLKREYKATIQKIDPDRQYPWLDRYFVQGEGIPDNGRQFTVHGEILVPGVIMFSIE